MELLSYHRKELEKLGKNPKQVIINSIIERDRKGKPFVRPYGLVGLEDLPENLREKIRDSVTFANLQIGNR